MSGSCVCGATGNCPMHAYARKKAGYRVVADGAMGWAFGVVDSQADVPDLVFASNGAEGKSVSACTGTSVEDMSYRPAKHS